MTVDTARVEIPESYGADSWDQATAFADSLGTPPASVTALIRALVTDAAENPYEMSMFSTFFLARFFQSRSFQAPYFYAIAALKPERLGPEDEPFKTIDFLEAFSTAEHAVLTGMIFLHRMAARHTDPEVLELVTELLQRGLNLGWHIGRALPPVGQEAAMLVAACRWIGLLPLARHDKDGLRAYLRYLKRTGRMLADSDYEFERWGCTSIQIALMLLQRLGFGTRKLVPLLRAMATSAPPPAHDPVEHAYRVSEVWLRFMLDDRSSPQIPLPAAFYLDKAHSDEIATLVLSEEGMECGRWLSAQKEDITPENTPQLFDSGVSSQSSTEGNESEHDGSDVSDEFESAVRSASDL